MDHLANNTDNYDEEGSFEHHHHKVFIVHSPTNDADKYCRFIYMETNSRRLGRHTGHRISVLASTTGDLNAQVRVQDRTCSHPTTSVPKSRLRLVGWVRRDHRKEIRTGCDAFEDIRRICQEVPRTADTCSHKWTDAAIEALRAASVLRPLRESDDRGTIYGPDAPTDDPFVESL